MVRRRKVADTITVVDTMTDEAVGRLGNRSETGMLLIANTALVDDAAFQRRRTPLARIVLLDVVHEVHADRLRRTGVERGEHAGFAVGGHDLDVLETGVAQQHRHVFGALGIGEVFGRDGRQGDPVLEALHVGVVLRGELRADRRELGLGSAGGWCGRDQTQRTGQRDGAAGKRTLLHGDSPGRCGASVARAAGDGCGGFRR